MPSPLPIFDTLENHKKMENTHHPYPQDYEQAKSFIYSYRGSLATFNAYRREVERLLQWSAHKLQKPINKIKRENIEQYIQFCQSPPDEWIGLHKCDRFLVKMGKRVPNPNWRPFVITLSKTATKGGKIAAIQDYHLSQKALQAIFAILSSFYNYLIQEEYIEYNPVSQLRQKSKFIRNTSQTRTIRRLSELQWGYVIETAEILANQNPTHERTLFILNALYGMYLRISELSATERWIPCMNHFFRDSDGNWWFKTVGKGNKERNIVVSDAMLAALKRYRISLALPQLPDPNDTTPLLSKQKSKGPIASTRHVRTIVQFCFDQAYARMLSDGLGEDAETLKAATVHWLRHTGISDDVKIRPREHVRDDAGHSNSAITDHYIDVELRERHASGKKKLINPHT